ncbi:MAG: acetyl/propionyl/methylcrotonyl-CoA carboxylase subunit alpha [Alphaproteobacteria bacterium]
MSNKITKILIANRGEIACRVIRTARALGIETVAVYSDADTRALHVLEADHSVYLGPAQASESYLDISKVMAAVKESGADAVHPGYGFLSENPIFADTLDAAGVAFIGPGKLAIESMGDKITSKKIADEAGVSTVPGHMGLIESADEAVKISNKVGYPVMIKASAGGGGKGMRVAYNDEEAREGFERSKSEAASSFGDDRIFIERFVENPRHIEIQVIADSHGNVVYLGERECSIQRRNQKVIEEAPSPFLDEPTRKAMGKQACDLAKAVGYRSAGTVEFIVDKDRNFFFLEMNTRLQVEHPVTELVTGLDLVELMIRVAEGEKLPIAQGDVKLNGWAIESRIYAEDPFKGFLPSIGRLSRYDSPQDGPTSSGAFIRNDTGVYAGAQIPIYYDPMIAKLCTWAPTREMAINTMQEALDGTRIEGLAHNIPFLSAIMDQPKFISGDITTHFISEHYPEGFGIEVMPDQIRKSIASEIAALYADQRCRLTGISYRASNYTVSFSDGDEIATAGLRVPGGVRLIQDGHRFNYSYRQFVGTAIIRPHRASALMHIMPDVQLGPDLKKLICPMPGVLKSLHVSIGEHVEAGQMVAVVEAMKMENVLRAEAGGKIKAVPVSEGQSLAQEDLILELE